MSKETTIRAIGNSAGATIPKAMLERYRLAEGDRVHLVETEHGILITPLIPALPTPWLPTKRARRSTAARYGNSQSEGAPLALRSHASGIPFEPDQGTRRQSRAQGSRATRVGGGSAAQQVALCARYSARGVGSWLRIRYCP
jgi:bifunctional DNA-binding transcriptional regulator/antitoxin component of YhaV-PrlF toxin-antitoxin module